LSAGLIALGTLALAMIVRRRWDPALSESGRR
jgi:hypothetical protein